MYYNCLQGSHQLKGYKKVYSISGEHSRSVHHLTNKHTGKLIWAQSCIIDSLLFVVYLEGIQDQEQFSM